MTGKNDDPNGCPDTVLGSCEPVCARCGRDMTAECEQLREGGSKLIDVSEAMARDNEQLRAALAARTTPASDTAALLRAAAAGRREYVSRIGGGSPPVDRMRDDLLAEAATLDTAARIADGDFTPLYGLLPSWRWTEAMDKRVLAGTSDAVTADDVLALAARSPQPTPEADEQARLGDLISWASVDPQAFRRDVSELAAVVLAAGYRRVDLDAEDDAALAKLAAKRLAEAAWSNDRLSRDLRGGLATLSSWLDVVDDLPADDRPRAVGFARALLGAAGGDDPQPEPT